MNSSRVIAPPSAEIAGAYRLVENELDAVFSLIHDALSHQNRLFSEIIDYSFQLGGKRLRPLLTLLSGKALGKITIQHHRAAAALEMIHTGTLVHDDILDGAAIRRHLATLNLRWDSRTAVLAGDYLLTRAISLVTDTRDLTCNDTVADACRLTCEGELLQTVWQGNFAMTVDDYERVIGGKTASLLECATRLGAYFADADAASVERFARFGRSLGMAFQILDDLLDVTGDTQRMGKTLGTDLRSGKPTLPLILFLRDAPQSETAVIRTILERPELSDDDLAEIRRRLDRFGAVDAARRSAKDYVADALAALKPATDVSDDQTAAYDALASVARFVLSRSC